MSIIFAYLIFIRKCFSLTEFLEVESSWGPRALYFLSFKAPNRTLKTVLTHLSRLIYPDLVWIRLSFSFFNFGALLITKINCNSCYLRISLIIHYLKIIDAIAIIGAILEVNFSNLIYLNFYLNFFFQNHGTLTIIFAFFKLTAIFAVLIHSQLPNL